MNLSQWFYKQEQILFNTQFDQIPHECLFCNNIHAFLLMLSYYI